MGAVLSQGGDIDSPIAYFSRKLLDRETRYSTIKKECLAVILGIKAFETYLVGQHFILQTDSRTLKWLHQFRDKNARLTRWSLALQPYAYTVQHRRGRDNGNADGLSRLPMDPVLCTKKKGRDVAELPEDALEFPEDIAELPDHLGGVPEKAGTKHAGPLRTLASAN